MLKFIDLFAGIGGFHIALSNVGMKCVFVSEKDKYARETYKKNFNNIIINEDITTATDIPDFDILCAGFPCQPFSQAGKKLGLEDERGNLFLHIARILREKRPKAFILENVRYLLNHDKGRTFKIIKETIESEGYSFHYKVLKASEFGLPQNRPRLFMVGFSDKSNFEFPKPIELKITMDDILKGKAHKKIGYTLRVGGRGSGVNDRRNWDCYIVNGVERQLTVKEALRMQGFPEDFKFPVSNTQAMKQLGNSVAVPVVEAIGKKIKEILK
jgi:DNA (cytosine-5)-methyltransferase 1